MYNALKGSICDFHLFRERAVGASAQVFTDCRPGADSLNTVGEYGLARYSL